MKTNKPELTQKQKPNELRSSDSTINGEKDDLLMDRPHTRGKTRQKTNRLELSASESNVRSGKVEEDNFIDKNYLHKPNNEN